jgi:hypothetical protein
MAVEKNRDRLLTMFDDYVECALSEVDQNELERLLLESPEARREFWAFLQQETLIQKIEHESEGRTLAKAESGLSLVPSEKSEYRRTSWQWISSWEASLLAASLVLVIGLTLIFQHRGEQAAGPRSGSNLPQASKQDRPQKDDHGPVLLATWLGGPNADSIGGVAIAPDSTILIGATLPGADFASWQPERQEGTGDAAVLHISADGKRLLAVLRRAGTLDDLRADDAGNVYLIGSAGCAKLNPSLRTEWSLDISAKGGRIAPGPEGTAIVLVGQTVRILARDGKLAKEWTIPDRRVHDIVCDVASRLVFVTGSNIPGPQEGAIPFVHAFDLAGKKVWTAHDWSREQVAAEKLGAGSVGLRLVLSKDGELYVAGESRGGNTVWGCQTDNLKEKLRPKADPHQAPYGIGSQYLTFLAYLDIRSGRVLESTMLLGRAEKDRGSSMRPAALAVDTEGRIYVGGWAGATPPVSPGAVGLRGEGEGAFFCVFDRNFRRLYAARLCGGTTTAIASGVGGIVVAGRAHDGLNTFASFQSEPAGEEDGWLILFHKAPGIEYQSPILPRQGP